MARPHCTILVRKSLLMLNLLLTRIGLYFCGREICMADSEVFGSKSFNPELGVTPACVHGKSIRTLAGSEVIKYLQQK